MDKEVICPWCETRGVPELRTLKKEDCSVRERRCRKCGRVLAAYLQEEGDFMRKIRKFSN